MRKFSETIKTLTRSVGVFAMIATAGIEGAVLSTTPAVAQMHSGGGFHGGGFSGGGFHGGGFRGSAAGFHGGGSRFRGGRTAGFRGQHLDWHRYGYWRNGVWIGISPGYYDDAYDQSWSYYCDPESPYFDADYCGD
jgi:hypothetical protein